MKKIYLQRIIQHNKICYLGKINARDLVKIATKIEMGEVQDAQRPLNKKRVKDIAKYVAEKDGILPNTLTLATRDKKFVVREFEDTFFIQFPTTEKEFHEYENTIDVMDGQHRLYSFAEDFCGIAKDEDYEIGFTLYIQPSLDDRRRIFVSCNEKQEKVSGNLLMWFRERLGMLGDEDKEFYSLVQKLNNDTPLKGRIIMSAEKIKNGIKAKELIAILKKPKFKDMSVCGRMLTNDEKFDVIRKYLMAWENVVGFSFQSPRKEDGAAVKIAGIRYMLSLLPYIWERTMQARTADKDFESFFIKTLGDLITACAVEREKFFTCEDNKMYFRDRTATEEFVNQSIRNLQKFSTENFDPFRRL